MKSEWVNSLELIKFSISIYENEKQKETERRRDEKFSECFTKKRKNLLPKILNRTLKLLKFLKFYAFQHKTSNIKKFNNNIKAFIHHKITLNMVSLHTSTRYAIKDIKYFAASFIFVCETWKINSIKEKVIIYFVLIDDKEMRETL